MIKEIDPGGKLAAGHRNGCSGGKKERGRAHSDKGSAKTEKS